MDYLDSLISSIIDLILETLSQFLNDLLGLTT